MVKKTVKKKGNSSVDIKIRNVDKLIDKDKKIKCSSHCGGGYCLGVIGALIYYISTAPSFWWGVLGVLKSIVWPVFLVFEVLKYIGA